MSTTPAQQTKAHGTIAATHLALLIEELEDGADSCALHSIAPLARRNLAARLLSLADSLL